MAVKLITDTGADLPGYFVDRYNIGLIPVTVIRGGEPIPEGEISPVEVIEAQKRGETITTSAPSPWDVREVFEGTLAEGYEQVLAITLPAHSSKTCEVVLAEAERLNEKHSGVRIEVLDGYNASMAQGLLVLRVAELLEEGVSFEKAVAAAERCRLNNLLLVALETPRFAGLGGRLKALKAYMGTKLGLHPTVVVLPNKKPATFGLWNVKRIRQMDVACRIITEKAVEYWGEGARLAVAYAADAKPRAVDLARDLSDRLGIKQSEIILSEASAALIAHAGFGAVGIAVDHGHPVQWEERVDITGQIRRRLGRG